MRYHKIADGGAHGVYTLDDVNPRFVVTSIRHTALNNPASLAFEKSRLGDFHVNTRKPCLEAKLRQVRHD
jgi:hypothetical protein